MLAVQMFSVKKICNCESWTNLIIKSGKEYFLEKSSHVKQWKIAYIEQDNIKSHSSEVDQGLLVNFMLLYKKIPKLPEQSRMDHA